MLTTLSFLLRLRQNKNAAAVSKTADTPTAAAMPPIAAVDRPEVEGATEESAWPPSLLETDVLLVVAELEVEVRLLVVDEVGAEVAAVTKLEVEVESAALDVLGVVVGTDEVLVFSEKSVPTTTKRFSLTLKVAHGSGFSGIISNRPTPLSQQFFMWSQQYDVPSSVTCAHDIRSVPPAAAPRQR